MKLAGLLACTLMVIPSADAVDAIKTCACLLKECRYLILIGVFSLFDYNMIATEATRILKCATHASSCKNSEGLEGNLALYISSNFLQLK